MAAPDTNPDFPSVAGVPMFYVNNVAIRANATDMALTLGVKVAGDDIAARVVALMAWEQAHLLRELLNRAIVGYEKDIGPIRDLTSEDDPATTTGLARSGPPQEADLSKADS